MAQLFFKYSTMNAGKSIELIKIPIIMKNGENEYSAFRQESICDMGRVL